ncbi:hypothetical protein EDC01DRAFT_746919 [Geopyxis carbonaria]|nr:hypothetical protein EDC01DRAFT_746919 [Geopyxis carbonaria]
MRCCGIASYQPPVRDPPLLHRLPILTAATPSPSRSHRLSPAAYTSFLEAHSRTLPRQQNGHDICAGHIFGADKFNVSTEVATLGLSMKVLGWACGPLVISPMSEVHLGRNTVYISTWFLFAASKLSAALVKNIGGFLVCRLLAGIFGSPMVVIPLAPARAPRRCSRPARRPRGHDSHEISRRHNQTQRSSSPLSGHPDHRTGLASRAQLTQLVCPASVASANASVELSSGCEGWCGHGDGTDGAGHEGAGA